MINEPKTKQLSDFPELKTRNEIYHRISIEHFKEGLDTNIFLDDTSYLYLGEEWFNNSKLHILELLFEKTLNIPIAENKDDLYQFSKKTLLSLKDIISQKLIERIAINAVKEQQHTDLIDFMLEHKLIDINMKYEGYSLLMNVTEKRKIDHLIKLGCDVNAKIQSPSSPWFDKTIYEVALKSKKKG